MLYNPQWDQHTLFDQWIAWLETKDPNEHYEWWWPEKCACGQFYGNQGWVGLREFARLNSIARGDGRNNNRADWTFGKCLERAKKIREWERLGYLQPCQ